MHVAESVQRSRATAQLKEPELIAFHLHPILKQSTTKSKTSAVKCHVGTPHRCASTMSVANQSPLAISFAWHLHLFGRRPWQWQSFVAAPEVIVQSMMNGALTLFRGVGDSSHLLLKHGQINDE